jgi:hypothetical protein
MGSIHAGVTLTNMPGYPEIAEDYRRTFAAQQALNPDIRPPPTQPSSVSTRSTSPE